MSKPAGAFPFECRFDWNGHRERTTAAHTKAIGLPPPEKQS